MAVAGGALQMAGEADPHGAGYVGRLAGAPEGQRTAACGGQSGGGAAVWRWSGCPERVALFA